jgi:hypothetical protein
VPKVPAVGFAFFSPDGIRVMFMYKPYKIFMHTNPDELPKLGDGGKNLVLVPNIDRLDDLIPLADKIYRVVVFARGKHEVLLRRGIPLIDSIVQDDDIVMVETRTTERYCQAVENEAVEVELKISENVSVHKKIAPVVKPEVANSDLDEEDEDTSLIYHIDQIAGAWAKVRDLDFDGDFVEPSALFCVGEIAVDVFKQTMKNLIAHGLSKDAASSYFRWLKTYQTEVIDAAREAVDGETPIRDIALRYDIPETDLTLIAEAYAGSQT